MHSLWHGEVVLTTSWKANWPPKTPTHTHITLVPVWDTGTSWRCGYKKPMTVLFFLYHLAVWFQDATLPGQVLFVPYHWTVQNITSLYYDYCNITFHHINLELTNKLQNLQNSTCITLGSKEGMRIGEIQKAMYTLSERLGYHVDVHAHACATNKSTPYLNNRQHPVLGQWITCVWDLNGAEYWREVNLSWVREHIGAPFEKVIPLFCSFGGRQGGELAWYWGRDKEMYIYLPGY